MTDNLKILADAYAAAKRAFDDADKNATIADSERSKAQHGKILAMSAFRDAYSAILTDACKGVGTIVDYYEG